MSDYPMGARVTYKDANATTKGDTPVDVSGTVNDEVVCLEDGRLMVPVWSEREGREATTVYVDARNIESVEAVSP